MDDRKKRLANSLLKAFGGESAEQQKPSMPSPAPAKRPIVDLDAAKRAEKSMKKAFGGEENEENQPSPEQLNELSGDLNNLLGIRPIPSEEQDERDELMRQLQLEYLRKKSLGQ